LHVNGMEKQWSELVHKINGNERDNEKGLRGLSKIGLKKR